MSLPPVTDRLRQQLPRSVVSRPDLEGRLDVVPPSGLAALVASAGSGKSVLVRQWSLSRPGSRVASLALTRRHTDIGVLVRDLVASVRSVVPWLDPRLATLAATGRATLGPALIEALVEGLEQAPQDCVLVLEDVHILSGHPVVEDLGEIFTRLPPSTRGVVTMRRDVSWPLHRLRLDDRLVELRGADLAFGQSDARALLDNVSHRSLTDEQVAVLLDRTDGWAAGLQLAAISLRTARDIPSFIASFAGSDHLVAEYLLHEVIEEQEPAVRQFLLQTSILDWLSADECNAVTGMVDGTSMLARLYQGSMFVIPLDESGATFRYHHLFADVLRYRLRIEDPQSISELHRRAARWLLAHGHEEEAVAHLLEAGDHDEAFDIISRVGHHFLERGEAATLVRWLRALGGEDSDGPVDVAISLLAAQLGVGDGAAAKETHRQLSRRGDLTPGERVTADALYSFLVFRDLPPELVLEVTDGVRGALAQLATDEVGDFLGIGGAGSVQVIAEYTAAVAHFFAGDLERAGAGLGEAQRLPGMQYLAWHVNVLSTLALVRACQGHCTEARRLARAAIDESRSFALSDQLGSAHAHLALALVHLDRVEVDDARHCLAGARLHLRGQLGSGINAEMEEVLRARLTVLEDGPVAALRQLGSPRGAGSEVTILREQRHVLMTRLLIGTGDVAAARAHVAEATERMILAPALVDVALAVEDVPRARAILDEWRPAPGDLRDQVRRELREFCVARAEGEHRAAERALGKAVVAARVEELRWPFLEVSAALRALRRGAGHAPWLTDDALWQVLGRIEPSLGAQQNLVDALTPRELDVLAYLPGRMKHQEIAADLFVSVNTVKTHLSSIYRKLGVTERNAAITRASDLGLL